MSELAKAFDDMLHQQAKEAATQVDNVSLAVLGLHKQMVSEQLVPDDAGSLFGLSGGIKSAVEQMEQAYDEAVGGTMPAAVRKKALGKLVEGAMNRARDVAAKRKAERDFKASLPEGAIRG